MKNLTKCIMALVMTLCAAIGFTGQIAKKDQATKIFKQPTIAVLDFTIDKQAESLLIEKQSDRNATGEFDEHVHKESSTRLSRVKHQYSLLTDTLTSNLTNYLVQSHQFRVLERAKIKQLVAEQRFNASEYVSKSNAITMGKLLGANYLVMGKIENIDIRKEKERVPYVDQSEIVYKGLITVQIQVVDTKSGQVVAAYPIQTEKRLQPREDEIINNTRFLNALKDQLAKKAVNEILATVFPVKVIAVKGQNIYLNRGKSAPYEIGSVLDVFQGSAPLTDPDSGQVLGVESSQIGQIKISKLTPKYAVATLIKGDASIMKGATVSLAHNLNDEADDTELTPGSSNKPLNW